MKFDIRGPMADLVLSLKEKRDQAIKNYVKKIKFCLIFV